MDGQTQMEAYLDKTMHENNIGQEKTINGMMKSIKVGCSYEEKSISLGPSA